MAHHQQETRLPLVKVKEDEKTVVPPQVVPQATVAVDRQKQVVVEIQIKMVMVVQKVVRMEVEEVVVHQTDVERAQMDQVIHLEVAAQEVVQAYGGLPVLLGHQALLAEQDLLVDLTLEVASVGPQAVPAKENSYWYKVRQIKMPE